MFVRLAKQTDLGEAALFNSQCQLQCADHLCCNFMALLCEGQRMLLEMRQGLL